MENIFRLKTGKELKKLGFDAVRFKSNGKVVYIGAALFGKYGQDLICIEKTGYTYDKKKAYRITGENIKGVIYCTGHNLLKIVLELLL